MFMPLSNCNGLSLTAKQIKSHEHGECKTSNSGQFLLSDKPLGKLGSEITRSLLVSKFYLNYGSRIWRVRISQGYPKR